MSHQHPFAILLVEDNPADAYLICDHLQQSGYQRYHVDVASSLAEARIQLTRAHYDAILLDLSLPDSMGLNTFFNLQQAIIETPVIILTGLDDEEVALNAVRSGAQDYLIKGDFSPLLLDRSIRYAMERARNESQARLQAIVFDSVSEGIMITDVEGKIVAVNPAFTTITRYTPNEILGQKPRVLKSDRHDPDFYNDMWSHLNANGQWQGEVWNRRKNGQVYPQWLAISSVKNRTGQTTHYVGVMIDITERKRAEDRLFFRATHDHLTGLPNRDHFHGRLVHAVAHSRNEQSLLAVMVIDLDGFKAINDTLGHLKGDTVLKIVARRLVACVRKTDLVARLGGDEFTIVLENLPDSTACSRIAQTIITSVSQPIWIDASSWSVGASIGISLCPQDGEDAATLLDHADVAMYRAKNQRSNYAFYIEEPSS